MPFSEIRLLTIQVVKIRLQMVCPHIIKRSLS
jgi:hypothetical protein